MCGIAGLISTSADFPKSLDPEKIIQRMIEKLRHRGPEAVKIQAFNKPKLASIGLRSGEYGGRYTSIAPAELISTPGTHGLKRYP